MKHIFIVNPAAGKKDHTGEVSRHIQEICREMGLEFAIYKTSRPGHATELVQQMITRGNVSGAMRMPMYYVYLALPVSSFILCVRLVAKTLVSIKDLFTKKEGAE